MKKFALAAALATAAVAAAPAAYAAPMVFFDSTTNTGVFLNNAVTDGPIDDIFEFDFFGSGIGTADITSITFEIANAITLTSVTFNNTPFTLTETVDADGKRTTGYVFDVPVVSGKQRLEVKGTSTGNNTYTGNIKIKVSPVPEPATWALMIVGFGMVGSTLRRRRTVLA